MLSRPRRFKLAVRRRFQFQTKWTLTNFDIVFRRWFNVSVPTGNVSLMYVNNSSGRTCQFRTKFAGCWRAFKCNARRKRLSGIIEQRRGMTGSCDRVCQGELCTAKETECMAAARPHTNQCLTRLHSDTGTHGQFIHITAQQRQTNILIANCYHWKYLQCRKMVLEIEPRKLEGTKVCRYNWHNAKI